jgi:hypothetical protein
MRKRTAAMRWSRRGADFLPRVRSVVYNGAFGSGFGNTFDTAHEPPLAA